jgi:hypothetical protein
MSEIKDNSGVAFATKEKKNPKAPDYSGPVTINGVAMRAAVWKRSNDKGDLLSMTFEPAKSAKEAA